MSEQLAVEEAKAEELKRRIKATVPFSPEEAAVRQEMVDAREAAHAAATGTIVETLKDKRDTGELFLPRTEAQHLAHSAVEQATSAEHVVPTLEELVEKRTQMGVEQEQPQPAFFDQEKH